MQALTLIRPWCCAIAELGKVIENRSWSPSEAAMGQRIAIHAGRKWDETALDFIRQASSLPPAETEAALDRARNRDGAIVATALLVRVVYESSSPWFVGPRGWVLADVRPLAKPVPCRGAQSLWTVPPDAAEAVLNQNG